MKPIYKFLLRFFLFAVPIGALVIFVNFKADPAHLFDNGSYEAQMAKYLLQGKNVTNVTNYDARILQRDFLRGIKKAPEVIVLASSRGMFINSDVITDKTIINSWTQSGVLEDFMALYDVYEENKLIPKKVIITLDSRILNKNNERERWKSISSHYYSMLKKIGLDSTAQTGSTDKENPLWQLVSASYFQASLTELKSMKEEQSELRVSDKKLNKGDTRLPDGSMSYAKKRREVDTNRVKELATEYISKPISTDDNFNELSATDIKAFETFVHYLQKQNITVEFFFAPFHPIVYKYFKNNPKYKNVLAAETYFKKFARENKIKCYGDYNPAVYNVGSESFYDAIHCTEKCIKLVYETDKNK